MQCLGCNLAFGSNYMKFRHSKIKRPRLNLFTNKVVVVVVVEVTTIILLCTYLICLAFSI